MGADAFSGGIAWTAGRFVFKGGTEWEEPKGDEPVPRISGSEIENFSLFPYAPLTSLPRRFGLFNGYSLGLTLCSNGEMLFPLIGLFPSQSFLLILSMVFEALAPSVLVACSSCFLF